MDFLCATPQIQISVAFQQSLGAGMFGGDGFLLQKLSGQGIAWLELSGELVVRDLQPGETLRVHPGHVGAFQASVSFQVTTVPGIKNMFFGGDGIFLASLTGPGRVWLQTLPIAKLAHAIEKYLPREAPRASGRGRSRRRNRGIDSRQYEVEGSWVSTPWLSTTGRCSSVRVNKRYGDTTSSIKRQPGPSGNSARDRVRRQRCH